MGFRFKSTAESMPPDNQVVLVFLEGTEPDSARWALAYFDGSSWGLEFPPEVVQHVEELTGHELRPRETIVALGTPRISYWARLPRHPEFDVYPLSEVERKPDPVVRYNRKDDTVDIFGGTTNYTEENPYFLDRRHFDSPSSALKAMAHVAPKRWVGTEGFLYALAEALSQALEARRGK
jgi:hypothetical protein